MQKNKKAYMRTLEMLLAFTITFLFVFFVLPRNTETQTDAEKLEMLSLIKNDITLRECIIDYNTSCVNESISRYFPDFLINYDYVIDISNNADFSVSGLPVQDVSIDSFFISGSSSYNPRIIKVFYWKKG